MTGTINRASFGKELRDYVIIAIAMMSYAIGWGVFLLPNNITTGGVAGVSSILYWATGIPVQLSYSIINGALLAVALKVLGWKFCVKTVFAVVTLTVSIGLVTDHYNAHLLEDQPFMAAIIGSVFCGCGVGLGLANNGSTGGTDIIAAIVNKYRDVSLGRVILICDIIIIACGFIVGNTIEDFIYSCVVMGVCSYCIDLVLTGNKQTVQAFIFTSEPEKVADRITNEMHRGVTVINGTGWYTKHEGPILMVVAHKRESQQILRIVKDEDPAAFMTMNMVMGAYGKGFEQIKR